MNKTKKNMPTDTKTFIDQSADIKPSKLYMKDITWKYLVRSALRGKNILIVGPTGHGKTFAVQCLVEALSETIEEEVTEERLNELKATENITIIKTEELK
jgi:DNA replication protein DnaC